jgi:hypothetical protein
MQWRSAGRGRVPAGEWAAESVADTEALLGTMRTGPVEKRWEREGACWRPGGRQRGGDGVAAGERAPGCGGEGGRSFAERFSWKAEHMGKKTIPLILDFKYQCE